MRIFKFRAWENSKMYYQVRCGGIFDDIPTAPTVWNEAAGDWLNLTGQPYTKLMQYTGLKDKNGCEIYEGDIVSSKNKSGGCEPNFDEVVFNNGRYVLRDKDNILLDMWIYDDDLEEIEVIGNVFNNPKLLEEQT